MLQSNRLLVLHQSAVVLLHRIAYELYLIRYVIDVVRHALDVNLRQILRQCHDVHSVPI